MGVDPGAGVDPGVGVDPGAGVERGVGLNQLEAIAVDVVTMRNDDHGSGVVAKWGNAKIKGSPSESNNDDHVTVTLVLIAELTRG